MDFGKAALLIATVFGLTEFVKAIGPTSWFYNSNQAINSRVTAVSALVVGEVSVFLVAASFWAHAQVLNGAHLDNLNVASKALVGLFVAGAAAFGDKVLGAVKNIGQNVVQKPIAK